MSFFVKKILEPLGKQNKPVYAVVCVALFKGILRPTFTMMDKKSDPETKKYAAVREGATELTALVTYPVMSFLTEKLAPQFSPNGKTVDQLLKSSKATLGFFGVCIAALYVIPKTCNIIMPSVMKALKMNKPEQKNKPQVDQNTMASTVIPAQTIQTPIVKTPVSMKGGMRI